MVTLRGNRRLAFGRATPARAAAALATPLVVAGGLALPGWVPWPDLLAARTVTLFVGLAALAAAAAGGLASRAGRRATAAAWVAGAVALGAGASLLATRIDGEVDAGLEEEGAPWRIAHAGLAARPPALKVLELPATRTEGRVRLLVEGREVVGAIGREVAIGGGRRIAVRDVFVAPAFVVERSRGAAEGSALVKLEPGRRDWFMAGVLPHRFYVTLPEQSGAALVSPRSVHVRVQRGKLRVHEGDLAMGGEARFEGLRLRFVDGAPWARIELRSSPSGREVAASGLLVAAAFLAARRRRALRADPAAG